MKVMATSRGDYGLKLRERGDVFVLVAQESPIVDGFDSVTREPIFQLDPATGEPRVRRISAEAQFSEAWMERVSDDMPESATSGQEALNREIEARLAGRA